MHSSAFASSFSKQTADYVRCKCKNCEHDVRYDCISARCDCCDLEDGFSICIKGEFDWSDYAPLETPATEA